MFLIHGAAQAVRSSMRSASCGRALALAAASLALLLLPPGKAQAQRAEAEPPLQITVTPDRIPTAIQRVGSAVSVIRAEVIERASPATLADVLRSVPGLDVAQAGGPGAPAGIRIRGANAGQTLVLIDGLRINDPSSPTAEFDSSLLAPSLIERIEVLRGPQSALYGSDAIGGVVNIITRRGRGAPSVTLRTEAGSYGATATQGSLSGSHGPWSYAFAGSAVSSGGFSALGHRIGRFDRFRPLEKDPYTRFGGFGRVGYDPGNGFRFDIGALSVETRAKFDDTFPLNPNARRPLATNRFDQISAKAELDTFGGVLTHALQLYANQTRRVSRSSFDERFRFEGTRYGAEYQARLRLDAFGTVIAGSRIEREEFGSRQPDYSAFPPIGFVDASYRQTTSSLFALWQLPIGERLVMSLGGRYDKTSGAEPFLTWRATAAYLIPEWGTKLRASAGTGAKAPSLFQRYSEYGTPGLRPERSFGIDAGIDQSFLDGRVSVSVTGFHNRLKSLIDFDFGGPGSPCLATQVFGCYVNVNRAETSGVEVSARASLIDGYLGLVGNYTQLRAVDLATGKALPLRAPHQGRVALQITPLPGLLIEPSVTFASARFSSPGERNRLAPYARFDVHAEYAVSEHFKVHARVENIADARYQDVRDYGTTGRAFYAGLTTRW